MSLCRGVPRTDISYFEPPNHCDRAGQGALECPHQCHQVFANVVAMCTTVGNVAHCKRPIAVVETEGGDELVLAGKRAALAGDQRRAKARKQITVK